MLIRFPITWYPRNAAFTCAIIARTRAQLPKRGYAQAVTGWDAKQGNEAQIAAAIDKPVAFHVRISWRTKQMRP